MSNVVLGIVGSRALEGNARAYRVIHEYLSALRPERIVSGGSAGIDSMGVEVALGMGYEEDQIIIHLPEPRSTSRWDYIAALFARNTLIVNDATDLLAIMVPGGSSGTIDSITKAKARPIPVYTIYVEPEKSEKCIHCGEPHDAHGPMELGRYKSDHFFE